MKRPILLMSLVIFAGLLLVFIKFHKVESVQLMSPISVPTLRASSTPMAEVGAEQSQFQALCEDSPIQSEGSELSCELDFCSLGEPSKVTLSSVVQGAFTAQRREEALLNLQAECVAPSPDGWALVRKESNKWKKVSSGSQEYLGNCVLVSGSPDSLLCENGGTNMGETVSSLWFIRIIEDKPKYLQRIAFATENSGSLCQTQNDTMKWKMSKTDLVVDYTRSRAKGKVSSSVECPQPPEMETNSFQLHFNQKNERMEIDDSQRDQYTKLLHEWSELSPFPAP